MLDGVQFAMLVDVVQLAQNPQWMRPSVLPSVVRLQSLDERPHFRGDGVESAGPIGGYVIPSGKAILLGPGGGSPL